MDSEDSDQAARMFFTLRLNNISNNNNNYNNNNNNNNNNNQSTESTGGLTVSESWMGKWS